MAHGPLPWFWSRHNASPSLSTQQSQKLPICQFLTTNTKYSTGLDQNHQHQPATSSGKSMEIPGTAANFVKTFSKKQRSSKVLRRSNSSRIKRPTMGNECKISKYLNATSLTSPMTPQLGSLWPMLRVALWPCKHKWKGQRRKGLEAHWDGKTLPTKRAGLTQCWR